MICINFRIISSTDSRIVAISLLVGGNLSYTFLVYRMGWECRFPIMIDKYVVPGPMESFFLLSTIALVALIAIGVCRCKLQNRERTVLHKCNACIH